MARTLSKAEVVEFPQLADVVVRFHSNNGSSPVVIVGDGIVRSAEDIGFQILELFNFRISSEVFEEAEEAVS